MFLWLRALGAPTDWNIRGSSRLVESARLVSCLHATG